MKKLVVGQEKKEKKRKTNRKQPSKNSKRQKAKSINTQQALRLVGIGTTDGSWYLDSCRCASLLVLASSFQIWESSVHFRRTHLFPYEYRYSWQRHRTKRKERDVAASVITVYAVPLVWCNNAEQNSYHRNFPIQRQCQSQRKCQSQSQSLFLFQNSNPWWLKTEVLPLRPMPMRPLHFTKETKAEYFNFILLFNYFTN